MEKPTDKTNKEKVEDHRIVANCWQQDFKDFRKLKDDEEMPVLILGETGTGKELIARHLHSIDRPTKPFVPVNCALIDRELMESKLFGHVKGAFTGATMNREGVFQEAADGTLFLDEFQELCPSGQASLLRAVEQREFQKLGSNKPERVRCRIILASSKDLSSEDNIRQDLYYRINRFQIFLPSLYQREEDVLILTRHFVECFNKNITAIDGELLLFIMTWKWLGNVRELLNFLYHLCKLSDKNVLDLSRAYTLEHRSRSAFNSWPRHAMGVWFSSRLRSVEDNNLSELKKAVSCRRNTFAEKIIPEPWRRRDQFGNPTKKIIKYDDISVKRLPRFSHREVIEKWDGCSSITSPLKGYFETSRHWFRKVKQARDLMNAAEERNRRMSYRLSDESVGSRDPLVTFGTKFPKYDEARKAFDSQYILELQQQYGPQQKKMAEIAGKGRKWVSEKLQKSVKD
ncbi:MAG: sigma 54-interacting transcriptional regulator [Candidatus Zixiibacteriota bacterium]